MAGIVGASRAGPSHLAGVVFIRVLDLGERGPSYMYWSEHNSQFPFQSRFLPFRALASTSCDSAPSALCSSQTLAGDRVTMRICVLLAGATAVLGTTFAAPTPGPPVHNESAAMAALGGGNGVSSVFGQIVKDLWVSAHARR